MRSPVPICALIVRDPLVLARPSADQLQHPTRSRPTRQYRDAPRDARMSDVVQAGRDLLDLRHARPHRRDRAREDACTVTRMGRARALGTESRRAQRGTPDLLDHSHQTLRAEPSDECAVRLRERSITCGACAPCPRGCRAPAGQRALGGRPSADAHAAGRIQQPPTHRP
jgi:hypothetical protein